MGVRRYYGRCLTGPHLAYITFSEDLAYGFVERTAQTATSVQALGWLDSRLTDEELPALPHLSGWNHDRAARRRPRSLSARPKPYARSSAISSVWKLSTNVSASAFAFACDCA